MGGSGLDRTDDFFKFCGSGLDRIHFLRIRIGHGLKNFTVRSSLVADRGEHGQDRDYISCRILAMFLDQDWIWISIFEKNWIRTRSGYLFDFYNEIFLAVIQDVTNDGAVVFFAMIFIFTKNQHDFVKCAALITIDVIRVTSSQIFSGEVEVVSCSYVPGMLLCFVVLSGICVLCRLIYCSLFHGWPICFDWDRLENFLITRDRPVGNIVTNTKYHMCKCRVPSP